MFKTILVTATIFLTTLSFASGSPKFEEFKTAEAFYCIELKEAAFKLRQKALAPIGLKLRELKKNEQEYIVHKVENMDNISANIAEICNGLLNKR